MADVVLKIDGIEVAAPKGMFILEAARRAGIAIPNYCAHPDLRPWGECRMCTVEVQTKRGRWTEIACSTPVTEGSEVFTNTKKIRDTRRFLLEGMFVHHPLDCPICDKSGECDLQSMGYEYEVPAANPFRRVKMAWEYDYLSAAITIKRDRCVQCGRCVRICDEVIGAQALAFVKRSEDMYISTPWEGSLLAETNCTSCGMCVAVCPVGALLYTPSKDTLRAWELTRTPSICPHCSVGCNLKLQVEKHTGYLRRVVTDRETGVNDGRTCVKGRSGYEFVHAPERITAPLVKRDGRFEPATWEEALALVAERFRESRGDRFAAIASARLTNEAAYLLQKLARAVMGTNNVESHVRLADAPVIYGLLDTTGAPGWTSNIYDLKDNAGCVLLIGANIADSQPVLWYMLQESLRRRNATLIVVDPRHIPPCSIADEWVRIRPGTDVAFLNGLAYVILRDGRHDASFVDSGAEGFEAWRQAVEAYTPERVRELTGVPVEQLERVARRFAGGGSAGAGTGERAASAIVGGTGLTQWPSGTAAVRAAANLAILTGNLGRPGGGVNFVRCEANAQGVSDMGLLADMLPGYRPVEDAEARAELERFWFAGYGASPSLPTRPGLTYLELIEAAMRREIGALWVLGEDVARAAPGSSRARAALEAVGFLVVSERFMTETAALADVILPSTTWAEESGTYTSTERRIQALQQAVRPVGESRPDWQVIAALGTRLGYEMRYLEPSDILEEIRRVTPLYAGVQPDRLAGTELHLTPKPGLVYGDRAPLVLERAGLQWPVPAGAPRGTAVLFGEERTSPPDPTRKRVPAGAERGNGAAAAASTGSPSPRRGGGGGERFHLRPVEQPPLPELPDAEFPLTLVVGGTLYQADLGTETGHCPTLETLDTGAFVGLAPADAERLGVAEGEAVAVVSRRGRVEAPARLIAHQPEGIVWLAPHYREAPIGGLLGGGLDPEAKTPALKSCPVKIEVLSAER